MSKNYELLQQAEFTLGSGAIFENREAEARKTVAPARGQALSSAEIAVREEVLKLVQSLFLATKDNSPKVVLFAAIDSNAGCNMLTAAVSKLLAESVSGTVCIVEGNFRKPALADTLGVSVDVGLVDSLILDGSIKDFTRPVGPDNLWLLAAGVPKQDTAVLLNSNRVAERLLELRKQFDYLVMNAPPLTSFADGMVLGRLADGVVLVLEADSTRREAAVRATEKLRAVNIPVLGAVLNNRTFPIPTAVYSRI